MNLLIGFTYIYHN